MKVLRTKLEHCLAILAHPAPAPEQLVSAVRTQANVQQALLERLHNRLPSHPSSAQLHNAYQLAVAAWLRLLEDQVRSLPPVPSGRPDAGSHP